jgi:hypothetical protein
MHRIRHAASRLRAAILPGLYRYCDTCGDWHRAVRPEAFDATDDGWDA